MGNANTVPKVRANDLKRLCGDENCGWLNKTGLTSTKFQKRWCAIHNVSESPRVRTCNAHQLTLRGQRERRADTCAWQLKLDYFDNPRSDEPNGVVELRGAIVTRSKNVKMAIGELKKRYWQMFASLSQLC